MLLRQFRVFCRFPSPAAVAAMTLKKDGAATEVQIKNKTLKKSFLSTI